jgi:3-oxoacyl-[acyl-carrier-protein] synthase-3
MQTTKIGITEIGIYIPDNYIEYDEHINKFDLADDFLEKKIGTKKVSRKFENQNTSDLCVKAFESLKLKINIGLDIDCLILVTQNPDSNGIPHTSSIIHKKLGIKENCAVFDVSLGCSGYVYGLSIMKSFMQCNNFSRGLLFTCDPYSNIVDMNDKNTSLLFGDAATVTFLTSNPKLLIEDSIFASRGNEGDVLNNDSGILEMDGRSVFNFSATEIPNQVKLLIERNNLILDDIDVFLFHQGSKFILDTLQRKLNIDKIKVPTNISFQGNTVSSSIPILLEENLNNLKYNRILISGFGVGLSWASAILNRVK